MLSLGKKATNKMSTVEVIKENSEVKFDVSSKLYSYNAIKQAAEDFSENFEIVLDGKEGEKISVSLKVKGGVDVSDVESVAYEFYNYVLGLMQNGF